MKIQIEVSRPRWLRLPRTRRGRSFAAMAVAALVVAVPVAWAGHDFADVPNGALFHNEISAIKNAGITTGCGGGNYCPTESVRRDAMAAFMHRGFGRGAHGPFAGEIVLDNTLKDISTLTITAGGATGATGFVKVDASFSQVVYTSAAGCPCQAYFQLARDSGGSNIIHYTTVTAIAGTGWGIDSGASTWIVAVPTGTTQTFRLKGTLVAGSGTIRAWAQMSAVYVPFGSSGGNTLAVESTAPKSDTASAGAER